MRARANGDTLGGADAVATDTERSRQSSPTVAEVTSAVRVGEVEKIKGRDERQERTKALACPS
jgi:hypothetical protein